MGCLYYGLHLYSNHSEPSPHDGIFITYKVAPYQCGWQHCCMVCLYIYLLWGANFIYTGIVPIWDSHFYQNGEDWVWCILWTCWHMPDISMLWSFSLVYLFNLHAWSAGQHLLGDLHLDEHLVFLVHYYFGSTCGLVRRPTFHGVSLLDSNKTLKTTCSVTLCSCWELNENP